MEDIVYKSPLEYSFVVCTPHGKDENETLYDNKIFDKLEQLTDAVFEVYWGLVHSICDNSFGWTLSNWESVDKNEILNKDWSNVQYTMKDLLNISYYDISVLIKDDVIQKKD